MSTLSIYDDLKDVAQADRKQRLMVAAATDRVVANLDNMDEAFALVDPATLKPTKQTATYRQLLTLLLSARAHESRKILEHAK